MKTLINISLFCSDNTGVWMRKTLRSILKDHLYGSSLWLIAGSIILTGFGFLFWTLCTRLFTSEQVGLASTLLSALELLAALSVLGLDIALIKFIPATKNKNRLLNSCFILAGSVGLLLSIVFLFNISLFSDSLNMLTAPVFAVIFIISTLFFVWYQLTGSYLIAIRKSNLVLAQDTVWSVLKVFLPLVLVGLGTLGIFVSWTLSFVIAFLLIIWFFPYKPEFSIDFGMLKRMFKFSSANYLSNFLYRAPRLLLPLIITALISPVFTAYYYVAWTISSVLYMIPIAISKSVLAQSNRENLKETTIKAIKFTFVLLLPAAVVMILMAKYLLLLFGTEYSESAFRLLQVFALASIPVAVNHIYIASRNVLHKMSSVIISNLFMAVGALILSLILLPGGILMIGIAWLSIHTVHAVFASFMLWRFVR